MTSTPLPNYAFRNHGGLRFVNEATAWGLETPSFSNGAAYGDLNGDGALDLVVNNVNEEAFVYRNNARTLHPENHFLQVRLDGDGEIASASARGSRCTRGARAVHAGAVADARLPVERRLRARLRARRHANGRFASRRLAGRTRERRDAASRPTSADHRQRESAADGSPPAAAPPRQRAAADRRDRRRRRSTSRTTRTISSISIASG